ncbi:unnamed protein product [Sphagnum jensenii]|uniref:SRR1-like domain-containing protein n=1 Tax=Sphagnum jensenii TaxID=128206 RepID=A0ABP0WJY9_9BRYO
MEVIIMPEEWTIVRTRRSKARSHQRHAHSPSFHPTVSSSTPTAAAASSSSPPSNGLSSSGNGTMEKLVGKQDGEGERRKMEEEEEHKKQLLVKVERSMEKVQHSAFFKKFMEQLQDLELLEILLGTCEQGRTVGETGSCLNGATSSSSTGASPAAPEILDGSSSTDSREHNGKTMGIDLVVFGVGSIADSEVSRCQIALAMLLKQKYESLFNKVLVYDPVLSDLEFRVLTTLGCAPICHDENGSRRVHVPTVFYMPHCEVGLYNNVLLANLEPWSCLSQVLVLGNSFHKYQERWSVFPQPMSPRPDCLLELQKKHVKEYIVDPVNFPLGSAFNDMSWHFFPHHRWYSKTLNPVP